jgi:hypothetical protein
MIPFDLTLVAGGKEKKLRFALVNHPKLTPLLVAITTFTGLSQNALYGESTTLHLQGEIRVKGHSTIRLENAYAPADVFSQDAFPIALAVQSSFMRLYTNTTEAPAVEGISLRVESTPGRQSFTIDSAWLEKTEARPGESVHVRVLLRPYRGPARVADLTVRVPEQSAPGTVLRVLVSDADWLNRSTRGFSLPGIGVLFPPSDSGLEQLISVINRERHNDRVYAGLFAPAPSLVWTDKEMPNIPLSQVNVLDGRPGPGGIQYFRESLASEDSLALGGPVAGVISLSLTVR